MSGLNSFDLGNLLKGPCNVLYADPAETDAPETILDIFSTDGDGYELADGWTTFGATTSGTPYSRQFSTTGFEIEQATGSVDEEVTEVVRAIQGNFGEVTPELLQMLEQASDIVTKDPAKGRSGEKQIRTGTVESLKNYMVAFVGRRLAGQGADVEESGGKVRGAFAVGGLLKAKITGDQAAINLARGQLASAPITFQAYIDDTQAEGEEHGFWFLEQPGEIEAAS